MREGICIAGNMIVDILYKTEAYPKKSELTTITDILPRSTGGLACNVAMDLASLDPGLPLSVIGVIGDDPEGNFIENRFKQYKNIDLSGIKRKGSTSFTLVIEEGATNTRTFFHYRGANAVFCADHIDWKSVNAKILHIGYILLLDALDGPDEVYGTKMARLLARAQQEGIRTSVDVVSEQGDRFKELVPPALRHTDYCVINELEAQQATGIPLRGEDGVLLEKNIKPALEKLFSLGVSTWAVIHSPEGGFGLDGSGRYVHVKSLKLPPGFIISSVGAGDAFCSGVLYAAYKGMDLEKGIVLGVASATCSLSGPGAAEGMRTADEALALYESLK